MMGLVVPDGAGQDRCQFSQRNGCHAMHRDQFTRPPVSVNASARVGARSRFDPIRASSCHGERQGLLAGTLPLAMSTTSWPGSLPDQDVIFSIFFIHRRRAINRDDDVSSQPLLPVRLRASETLDGHVCVVINNICDTLLQAANSVAEMVFVQDNSDFMNNHISESASVGAS